MEDILRETKDHHLIAHFYKAVREVTVLDPTCGSGAFLFAALNILEPLYEICLDRMEEFHCKNGKLFKDELAEIKDKFRSNQKYFVYKNIILRNLYGVDIMHEATEIARLRLFLKMMAVVDVDPYDENLGLDPLPDIDFNIRCGNTLVGYATEKEIQDGLVNGDMFAYVELKKRIEDEMTKASAAFDYFRREQLNLLGSHADLIKAKKEINQRLAAIRVLLDRQLYATNGGGKTYDQWHKDTQPFHWYTEFYPVMAQRGGFDVIIGNPPYVEYTKVKEYRINGYKTLSCGNLYAYVIERVEQLLARGGKTGMIIPHSAICTDRMESLFNIIEKRGGWFSTYDTRPDKLFDGVDQRLLIYILGFNSVKTTKYNRWNAEYRPYLFNTLQFTDGMIADFTSLSKISTPVEHSILRKVYEYPRLAMFCGKNGRLLYYHDAPRYFLRFMVKPPYFYSDKHGEQVSVHIKSLQVERNYDTIASVLNSSLYYFWFVAFSSCRNLASRDILNFRVKETQLPNDLIDSLYLDLDQKSIRKTCFYKATGKVVYDEYSPKYSKSIIDKIDELLAKHYGFTEEELDFIINYDIKYRMGDELRDLKTKGFQQ